MNTPSTYSELLLCQELSNIPRNERNRIAYHAGRERSNSYQVAMEMLKKYQEERAAKAVASQYNVAA